MIKDKEQMKQLWKRLINLAHNGETTMNLTNPAVEFTVNQKAGEFNGLSEEEYCDRLSDCAQISSLWESNSRRPAGELLLEAIRLTYLQPQILDQIVDLLTDCSASTNYPGEFSAVDDEEDFEPEDDEDGVFDETDANNNIIDMLTPKDIEQWLHTDGCIVGQEAAVKTAALIVFNHMMGRSSVNLFAGPTGSGKTEIWRALQKKYGAENIIIHDASTITAEGYRGPNKMSTLFKSLPADKREHMILVLDEFDKLLEPQCGSNGTDYRDLTQNQLLKLFDHDVLFYGDDNNKSDSFTVDASGITVVCLGAFQRLLEKKSSDTGSIGFGAESRKELNYTNTEITVEDLISYGMRAELAGRVNRTTTMNPLSETDLKRIGRNEAKNIGSQIEREVCVDDATIEAMAQKALSKRLGARWLKSELNNKLDDLVYEEPYARKYNIEFHTDVEPEFETESYMD